MIHGAQNAYLEAAMTSASPVQLVALLYQAGEDAARAALRHLEQGDIAARSQQISKASMVLLELAASLDHSRGGQLSRRLAGLYRYMLERLTQANLEQKAEPLCEVLSLLETLGSAWRELAAREIEAPPAADYEPSGEWHGLHEELAGAQRSVALSF
jgi:flagellar protein FliS